MIYIIEEITGAGYDSHDIGVFDSIKGACDAVLAHMDERGYESVRYNKKRIPPAYIW